MKYTSLYTHALSATKTHNLWSGQVSVPAFGKYEGNGTSNPVRWSLEPGEGDRLISHVTDLAITTFTYKARTVKVLQEQFRRRDDHRKNFFQKEVQLTSRTGPQKKLIYTGQDTHVVLLPGESCVLLTNDSPVFIVKYVDNDDTNKILVTKLTPLLTDITGQFLGSTLSTIDLPDDVIDILLSTDTKLHFGWVGYLQTKMCEYPFVHAHGEAIEKLLRRHSVFPEKIILDTHGEYYSPIEVCTEINTCRDIDTKGKNPWYSSLRGDRNKNLIIVNHHMFD